jgi:hypothetical protein
LELVVCDQFAGCAPGHAGESENRADQDLLVRLADETLREQIARRNCKSVAKLAG